MPCKQPRVALCLGCVAALLLLVLILDKASASGWRAHENGTGIRLLVEEAVADLPGQSRHKPLLPLNAWDKAGIFAAVIGLMIAAGGGIGGGGILVPVFVLVMRFHPKYAIPLSNITIFGGAITNVALNMSKRHPSADRPLVDWDLILVMEPLTIGGALVGSFINKVSACINCSIAHVLHRAHDHAADFALLVSASLWYMPQIERVDVHHAHKHMVPLMRHSAANDTELLHLCYAGVAGGNIGSQPCDFADTYRTPHAEERCINVCKGVACSSAAGQGREVL